MESQGKKEAQSCQKNNNVIDDMHSSMCYTTFYLIFHGLNPKTQSNISVCLLLLQH